MKIILNSDIVYSEDLVTTLARRLLVFARAIVALGHELVLPSTTVLEFERMQHDAADRVRGELRKALRLLDKLGISHQAPDIDTCVRVSSLPELLAAESVQVAVEDPQFDDLAEAHRRACLHQAPHPGVSKSDEMRDLVIWMIALRIAQADGGALLVSRDNVHSGPAGDLEAGQASLHRAESIEDALELLAVNGPAGRLMKQVLGPVWMALVMAGFPASEAMDLIGIANVRLRQGRTGLAMAACDLRAKATDNKTVRASIEVDIDAGRATVARLAEVMLDREQRPGLEVGLDVDLNLPVEDFGGDMDALRSIIEGEG